MPKGNRKQQKRQAEVAEKALQNEIKRNDQKIPDIVQDSALFKEDDDQEKVKKTKIRLNPRPQVEKKTAPPKTEFVDLWGDDENVKKPEKPIRKAKQIKPRKANLPTSAESYTSKDLTVKRTKTISEVMEKQEEKPETFDPAEEMEDGEEVNDGIGDSLAGDVPVKIDGVENIVVPAPDKKEYKDIILSADLKANIPVAEKMKLRKMIRENNQKFNEEKEKAFEGEFEKVKETAEELEKRKEEISKRPKREQVNHKERYIISEPLYQVDKVPESMADISGDQKQFARLQRDLELRGVVGLHH